jgi:hypothetical protein
MPPIKNSSFSWLGVSGDTLVLGIGGCPQDRRSGAGVTSRRRDGYANDFYDLPPLPETASPDTAPCECRRVA